jgi:hypothetical protein
VPAERTSTHAIPATIRKPMLPCAFGGFRINQPSNGPFNASSS